MNFTTKELEELTEMWLRDRKITINGVTNSQIIKFLEEFGETALGILQKDSNEIKDGLGDMAVVMTAITGLIIRDTPELSKNGVPNILDVYIEKDYRNHSIETPERQVLKLIVSLGKTCGYIARGKNEEAFKMLSENFDNIALLAIANGFDINESWNIAYNEIKDRKGFLNEDGIFIKQSDIDEGKA